MLSQFIEREAKLPIAENSRNLPAFAVVKRWQIFQRIQVEEFKKEKEM